jgi:glucose uptake protein
MVIVESYAVAVILCFVTMLCWGSWANTQKLASKKWRFQLYYWDYSLGVLLLALILAFTMGSFGEFGRGFLADLGQAESGALVSALVGGVVFNLANILLVAAIDIAGMAVAFPVGIGLALSIGVINNYIAVPVGNPVMLFLGVFMVVVAIILDAFAYKGLPGSGKRQVAKGLILSIIAGIAMGFFYRFVAASMSTDFINPEPGTLTPYTAVVLFSVGLLLSSFIWNTIVMYKPFSGEAVTYKDYFTKGDLKLHLTGILGGVIWSIGMALSIIAAGSAGFAISYGLGQGATMVAAFWGVFIWKEFREAPKSTGLLINLMFAFFILGLGMIIASRVM